MIPYLVNRDSYLAKTQIIKNIKIKYLKYISSTRYEILDTSVGSKN